MKSRIALHPEMGASILRHLQQFGDLPARGILAGQAVDSAITDLYGKGGGVYNDLDIFRNAPGSKRLGAENWATPTAFRSEIELRLHAREDDYNGMAAIVQLTRLYGIKSVSRQGMLNFVNCTMADGHMHRRLTAQDVIAGFDLNCTRVAVDLATGRLAWDRHYEQFLHSRQLRIVMMHTPWHTFLRLAKKSEELPDVYVDFAAAAEACAGVVHSPLLLNLLHHKSVSLLFGKKHLEQAEATRSIWTPYFNLEARTLARPAAGHWRAITKVPAGEVIEKCTTLYMLEPRDHLEPHLQERCDKLGAAVVFHASRVLEEARRTVSAGAVVKLQDVRDCRELAKDPDPKKPRDFVLLCADAFGTGYVAGQALPAVADKVADWLSKHGLFKRHFFGLTLAEQHARMQTIAQLARDFGNEHYLGDTEHALGVLELTATTSELQSRETMLALLEADHREAMKPFANEPLKLPTRLPESFADFTVTEMRRPYDLTREGREMHHCVGGYSHAIQRGGSRILSVKYKTHRSSPFCSTVELTARFRKDGSANGRLRIAQNFTHSNKAPNEENQAFVEFLRDYLELACETTARDASQLAQAATAKRAALLVELETSRVTAAQLEAQLKAARSMRRRRSQELVEATREVALYTILAAAQPAFPAVAPELLHDET